MSNVPEATSPNPVPTTHVATPSSTLSNPSAPLLVAERQERSPSEGRTDASGPIVPKRHLLSIGLGVLSGILFVVIFVLWSKVDSQKTSLFETANRTAQLERSIEVLHGQVEELKVAGVRLQAETGDAKAQVELFVTQIAKVKADAAELQAQMDKTRALANSYESKMAEANVAAIRQQGEAENAKAQTVVMRTQMDGLREETERLSRQLEESRAEAVAVALRLADMEKGIVQAKLRRP